MADVAQLRRAGIADAQVAARLRSGSWREPAPGVVAASGAPDPDSRRVWTAALATGVRQTAPSDRSPWAASPPPFCTVSWTTFRPSWRSWSRATCGARDRPGSPYGGVSDWGERAFTRLGGLLVTDYLALLQDVASTGRACSAACSRATWRSFGELDGATACSSRMAGRWSRWSSTATLHRLSRKAFLHDRAKDLALREAGCATLRFTVQQVDRPADLAAHVRRALAAAQLGMPPSTAGVA